MFFFNAHYFNSTSQGGLEHPNTITSCGYKNRVLRCILQLWSWLSLKLHPTNSTCSISPILVNGRTSKSSMVVCSSELSPSLFQLLRYILVRSADCPMLRHTVKTQRVHLILLPSSMLWISILWTQIWALGRVFIKWTLVQLWLNYNIWRFQLSVFLHIYIDSSCTFMLIASLENSCPWAFLR